MSVVCWRWDGYCPCASDVSMTELVAEILEHVRRIIIIIMKYMIMCWTWCALKCFALRFRNLYFPYLPEFRHASKGKSHTGLDGKYWCQRKYQLECCYSCQPYLVDPRKTGACGVAFGRRQMLFRACTRHPSQALGRPLEWRPFRVPGPAWIALHQHHRGTWQSEKINVKTSLKCFWGERMFFGKKWLGKLAFMALTNTIYSGSWMICSKIHYKLYW